jgi:cell division protein FtsB
VGLRDELKNRAAGLLGEPRVFQALQSEQLSRALAAVLDASGRLSSLTAEQRERVVRSLGLASQADLQKLEQRVEELEAQVARLRQSRDQSRD